MKPLKLRTRHMPTKVSKPPKKGKGAKYDRAKQKKSWKNESVKLSPILETIFKIRSVRLLVEQMILKENLGGWSSYFVIGPDAKVIRMGAGKFHYHGDSIKAYPKIYKEALKVVGGGADNPEGAVAAAIEDGKESLYKFMYERGFIRCGRYWVAFDPKKVPSKNLMVILQLAKESGVKKFDVETGVGKGFTYDMTIDEFIEKFL